MCLTFLLSALGVQRPAQAPSYRVIGQNASILGSLGQFGRPSRGFALDRARGDNSVQFARRAHCSREEFVVEQLHNSIKVVIVDGPSVLAAFGSKGDGVDDRRDSHALALLDAAGLHVEVMGSVCPFLATASTCEGALRDCAPAEIAYVLGSADADDLAVIEAIASAGGLVACPADASDAVRARAGLICHAAAGHGAMREVADYLLSSRTDAPTPCE